MKTEVVELACSVVPPLPPRSRLYHLEPVCPANANGLVECLTSYIARLAAAHCVPVGVLVSRELVPLIGRTAPSANKGKDLLGKLGASVNGNNRTAREAVLATEHLTTRTGLARLTMLIAGNQLAVAPLIRPVQAWCPSCLNKWSEARQTLYYPLLWNLQAICVCPFHNALLRTACPRCNRSHSPLARHLRVGHCPKCGVWLGDEDKQCLSEIAQTGQVTEWERYSSWAAAGLLSDLAKRAHSCSEEQGWFARNVSGIVEQSFMGSMNALAKFLHSHQCVVRGWVTRSHRPSLNSALVLAYRFTLSVSRLLLKPFEMNEAVAHPSTSEVDLPKLRAPLRWAERDRIEQVLRASIEDGSCPILSLRQVCTQAGFHQTQASRQFPDLARKVSEKYRHYKSQERQEKERRLKIAVRSAVQELHAANIYPGIKRVGEMVGASTHNAVACAERKAAMKDLGLDVRPRVA